MELIKTQNLVKNYISGSQVFLYPLSHVCVVGSPPGCPSELVI